MWILLVSFLMCTITRGIMSAAIGPDRFVVFDWHFCTAKPQEPKVSASAIAITNIKQAREHPTEFVNAANDATQTVASAPVQRISTAAMHCF